MIGGHTTAETERAVRGAYAAGRARTGGGKPMLTLTGESTQRRCGRTRRSAAAPALTERRGGNPAPCAGGNSNSRSDSEVLHGCAGCAGGGDGGVGSARRPG